MKKDYTHKIVRLTNKLHRALNECRADYNSKNVIESLDSLNYFVKKQLEVNNLMLNK
jgi:hypothetical protein